MVSSTYLSMAKVTAAGQAHSGYNFDYANARMKRFLKELWFAYMWRISIL